jgi:Arc/MetJ-type ribon-helix-helix transcriptional regulator
LKEKQVAQSGKRIPFEILPGMIYCHTGGNQELTASKIAITIDSKMLKQLDLMVESRLFPNRSKAIQEAVAEKLTRMERVRLARECLKLDPGYEQEMAEEGFSMETGEWPEY